MDDWNDLDLTETEESEATNTDVSVPDRTYTTCRSYPKNGTVVKAGTDIKVTCNDCGMWERSTATDDPSGKPMCRYGRKIAVDVDGETIEWRMNANEFSCQQKFLPKDLENLNRQLPQTYGDALALKWFIPTIRQALKVRQRIYNWFKRHNPDGDPEQAVSNALLCLTDFQSQEQLDYVAPLLADFAVMLKVKKAKIKTKKERFDRGDVVSWIDPASNTRIEGFVLLIGGRLGEITIMVDQRFVHYLKSDVDYAVPVSFPLSEWKERFNPEIVRKAEAPIKTRNV